MSSPESSADDRCRVITEVAVEQAMDKCGSREAVRNQLRRIVGLEDDGMDPDCEATLSEGLDEATLSNTRATRQWVMCEAWRLVDEEDMTISSAVSKAWAEANAAGEDAGIEV